MPPLANWTAQEDLILALISWCELIPFDRGFKHYAVPAPKEMPPQCSAMLLGIPFTSENSSLLHLLLTCLFAPAASRYSFLWLQSAQKPFSCANPRSTGSYLVAEFAPKAHNADTTYCQILSHFCLCLCHCPVLLHTGNALQLLTSASLHQHTYTVLGSLVKHNPQDPSLKAFATGGCPAPPSPLPSILPVLGIR